MVDEARRLLEVRSGGDRRSSEETLVARFRVEQSATVTADGKSLRVSDLTLKLDSSRSAAEVAAILKRGTPAPVDTDALARAEGALGSCLGAREEAMGFLSRARADPRGALLAAGSMSHAAVAGGLLEAVVSEYSARLSGAVDEAKSVLVAAEASIGAQTAERLSAVACTVGAVQDALFEGRSDLSQEVQALQGLGLSVTAEELRMEGLAERLMARARPVLEAVSGRVEPASEPLG
ncbi:MAG: hypothetical protein JRN23_02940 [Nitrososphaerota archaeon]|nr:hypothetical protein [Nitrososphaerota archaeon]MDG6966455.1 hypothetical protein [Nitrososphaerota archaeon]MDG6979147.1 hypothetical protein [Nitrososphaerota archaeon]MDG7020869.1 hypothetical protein [Nitrososphaerota archaeon]